MLSRALIVSILFGAAAAGASAQGLSAHLRGQVSDASGAAVPGATVTVTNTGTNSIRDTQTGPDGTFVFPDLISGVYDLSVRLDGFKTSEQKGIPLASTERIALTPIVLEVGGVEERVTVTREAPLVQTSSGARSGYITDETIADVALKGRDFVGMLKLLPGVIDTSAREAPTWTQLSGLSVNGRTGLNLSYDGITNKETGSNGTVHAAPGLDSIAEVRVQSANFQAEYGRSSGASIVVVTRSGSKDFRGSAAFYKRDGALNANEFSRKQQCALGHIEQCEAAPNNVDNVAWTIGGPVFLPGTSFNRGRNRLFFFWSQDIITRIDPGVLSTRRMPTAIERAGDFSQTFDSQRRLVFVRDPQLTGNCNSISGGPACFPGNIIPPSRMDPTGRAFLNLFPLPNGADPTGANQYNYTYQLTLDWPRNDQVLRVDWNVSPQTTVYGRLQFGYDRRSGAQSFAFVGGWPQMEGTLATDTISYVNTLLHSFNSTTFLEATAGVNRGDQHASALTQAVLDANMRSRVLPELPQFFPDANPLDLLPNATFNGPAGLGTIGAFQYEPRFPYYGYNTLWNFSGSLTKLRGSHSIKTGVFVEHTTRPVRQRSNFNGTMSFNAEGSNPLNSNIGFANALLGTISSYQKADAQPAGHGAFVNTEFYAQDNWRVTRTLTLDAGVRFYWLTPTSNRGGSVAQFEPGDFNPAAAPLLFQPIATAQGRRAVNPLTGEVLPVVYIGRLVPGSGDFINGTRQYDETPQQRSPFEIAPRVAFAWDVTGDGRTAIRGGAGAFYDRYADNDLLELTEIPPLVRTYTTGYSTIAELLSSPLTETPSGVRRFNEFDVPLVYNWSLGVQREIGWKIVGDIAYVGNAARRQVITRELNGRPYGYTYQPSSLDPTNVVGGVVQPLPDDLLRPYRGYGSIIQREFSGYSDYHSLQLSTTRRRGPEGLSFGVSYTYQIVNKTLGAIDPFVLDNTARNYNSAGSRPHSLVIHYSWQVPNLSRSTGPRILQAILDDWQISGVTSLLSGARAGFGYTYSGVPTGTLAGNGSIGGGANRPRIVCDPTLPRSDRTFERQFRTECIAAPDDEFHIGSARGDEFKPPGIVNWDVSVFKNIQMNDRRRLQLRVELYNAFNTRQWTGVNTAATFDYSTGVLTNPTAFGALTGATNSARRVQLGARFEF